MLVMYKKVTKSGSVSIPVALRRELEMQGGDAVEITVTEDNKILIGAYQIRCQFCQSNEEVHDFNGKGICKECAEKIIEQLGGGQVV